jgi:hypothetical protein
MLDTSYFDEHGHAYIKFDGDTLPRTSPTV